MNPEDRVLLERSLKLSEENHRILKKMERRFRWAVLWGFVKLAIIVVPIILGFLFLEPYFEEARANFEGVRGLLSGTDLPF